jgi:hypothetical protein
VLVVAFAAGFAKKGAEEAGGAVFSWLEKTVKAVLRGEKVVDDSEVEKAAKNAAIAGEEMTKSQFEVVIDETEKDFSMHLKSIGLPTGRAEAFATDIARVASEHVFHRPIR